MGMKGFAPKNHNIPEGDFEEYGSTGWSVIWR